MITVLNYNKDYADKIVNLLIDLGFPAQGGMNESMLCGSQQLIFPPSDEVGKVIKKIHLLNLYSMLRMVNKPVLGIGSGIEFMLEFAVEKKESALCYFPELSQKIGLEKIAIPPGNYPLKIQSTCSLLSGIDDGTQFHFEYALKLEPGFEIVKASFFNEVYMPAVCKKENYQSVMFDILKSGDAGITVLKNFVQSCDKKINSEVD